MKSVMIVAFALLTAVGRPARADGRRLRDLFRKVSASVVIVRTMEKIPAPEGFVEAPGLGSGVLVSTTGRVLTAAHVVQNTGRVTVEFMNGEQVPARVIGSVERADVAAPTANRASRQWPKRCSMTSRPGHDLLRRWPGAGGERVRGEQLEIGWQLTDCRVDTPAYT